MSEAANLDFTNPRLEWHMRFVCPECGAEHRSQQDWRRHLNDVHNYLRKKVEDFDFKEINDRYHECNICHKWVANAHQAIALLQYHRFLHLPFSRTYRCRHCTGAFTRKRALCEHLYRFHSRLIGRMEKLRRSEYAAEIAAIRNPKQNEEFYIRFLCPQCGKTIDRFQQWLQHLERAHRATSSDLKMQHISGTNNNYCLQCNKLFYTNDKAYLQRHRFTHLPYKNYFQCCYCSVKKAYKTEVLRHFVSVHPVEFTAAKQYMRKPEEWGYTLSDRQSKELSFLLYGNFDEKPTLAHPNENNNNVNEKNCNVNGKRNENEQTDLIQKALLGLMDMEMEEEQQQQQQSNVAALSEITTDNSSVAELRASTNLNEYALDQSLNDLEAILRNDLKESNIQKTSLIQTEKDNFDALELEALCEDMFEEIFEEDTNDDVKENIKVVPLANCETNTDFNSKTIKSENIKDEHDSEEEEQEDENVVSIEIDALNEADENTTANSAMNFSPKRKRLKLCKDVEMCSKNEKTNDFNDELKVLLETYIHYRCIECGKEFEQHSAWREHIFIEHNIVKALETNFQMLEDGISYLCLECMQVQKTTKHSELQRHRFMHMPFQSYLKCILCSKTKSSKPKILQHLRDYHAQLLDKKMCAHVNARKFKCNDCGKEFKTQVRWQNHRAQCWQRGGTTTTPRNYNISENLKLISHLRIAHKRIQRIAAEVKLSSSSRSSSSNTKAVNSIKQEFKI